MPRRTLPLFPAALLGAGLLACSSPEPPTPADEGVAATPSPTSAPDTTTVTPPPEYDGLARYRCSDGSQVAVRFGHYDATVRRADNTTFTLPRAESASADGIDVYVGMELALERQGEHLRVTRGGEVLTCEPATPMPR